LKLIAGDVNTVRNEIQPRFRAAPMMAMSAMQEDAAPSFS